MRLIPWSRQIDNFMRRNRRASSRRRRQSQATSERLESRLLLTITTGFHAPSGKIAIASDGGDQIKVGVSSGQVTVNDRGTGIAAADVRDMEIDGGAQSNSIDLRDVTPATFPGLSKVDIDGGAGNDIILGSRLDDLIVGGDGNDIIIGMNGNDSLRGGEGDDQLSGSAGRDDIDGEGGNDDLRGNGGSGDALSGGTGDDTMNGGAGNDRIVEAGNVDITVDDTSLSGMGNDVLIDVEGVELNLGDGDNSVDAGNFPGIATVRGGGGNDTIVAPSGGIYVLGGGGDDVVTGSPQDDLIIGMDGNDTINGMDGDDELRGSAGRDQIDGGEGDDDLFGQGGTGDILIGGPGDDMLNGGAGNDRVLENGDTDFTVDATSMSGAGNDILIGIEGAEFNLGPGNNTVDMSSFPGVSTVRGGAGDDVVLASGGGLYFLGFAGDDVVTGSDQRDLLIGMDGNDQLFGMGGNDLLLGSAGRDILNGGDGDDGIRGQGASGDIITGGAGDDTMDGGPGTDRIVDGGDTDITIDDTSMSGLGNDVIRDVEQAFLSGGPSANSIDASGFSGPTQLDGGAGPDALAGGSNDDRLIGDTGDDSMSGGAGSDTMFGEEGDDHLDGGSNDDLIHGGAGEDALDGGLGLNLLDGDAGVDRTQNGTSADVDQALEAALVSGGAAGGTAEFEVTADDDLEVELEIDVQNAPPGRHNIEIGGVVIGQITVAGDGSGSVEFSNDPDDAGELSLPMNLPTLTTGTTISIPDIVDGTFAPEGDAASGANGNGTILGAPLGGAQGTGSADFVTEFEDGIEDKELDINVEGLTANTTFDVSISGVVVGHLTTDSNGNGSFGLSTNPDAPDEQTFPGGFVDPEPFQGVDIGGVLQGVWVGI